MTDSPLDGLRVWVTGAGRGLGREIALDLSRAGARVALTARDQGALDAAAAECPGPETLPLAGSVTEPADLARVTEAVRASWGGLDALIHSAGISPDFHLAHEVDLEVWRRVIDTNLTGTFLCCRAAAELMPDGGSIVTVSSVHARSTGRRLSAYSASKGGVEALTRALALDWADRGIRVNCVAPGYFVTDMTSDLRAAPHQHNRLLDRIPLGALGSPDQLTGLVRLLAGPDSTYITGSVLAVDGGWGAA